MPRLQSRGVLGPPGTISGHSKQGRYLRAVEAQLLESLPAPTAAQRHLVAHVCRLAYRLTQLEESFQAEELPSLDELRIYSSLHGQYVSAYRELFGKSSARVAEPPAPPSLGRLFVSEASDAA